MNFLNKFLITVLMAGIITMPSFALSEIDTSVDDEIRTKYDPDRIGRDYGLPPLPENLKQEIDNKSPVQNPPKTTVNNEIQTKQYSTVTEKKKLTQTINLKSGMKFNARSISVITDKLPVGSRVYFKLSEAVKTKYYSLPENTKFSGVVVDSHTPQITGNGGLVEIVIDDIIVEGNWKTINAKITKVNYKNIYLNNIKGKRQYLANIANTVSKGGKFYDKMYTQTRQLAGNKITVILSPIPYIAGVTTFAGYLILSPVCSLFSKGKSLTIPSNTMFVIKLSQDVTIK